VLYSKGVDRCEDKVGRERFYIHPHKEVVLPENVNDKADYCLRLDNNECFPSASGRRMAAKMQL
jgi:hypothetical protein